MLMWNSMGSDEGGTSGSVSSSSAFSLFYLTRQRAHLAPHLCPDRITKNQDCANKLFLESSSTPLSSSSPSPSLSSSSRPFSSSGPLLVGMHWQPSQAAGKIWKDLLCSSLLTLLTLLISAHSAHPCSFCSAHHHSSNSAHHWQVPQLTQKQDGWGN